MSSTSPCTAQLYYADTDNDGFGDGSTEWLTCEPTTGWILQSGDCDDSDDSVHPGAVDSPCDNVDADCSGSAAQGVAAIGVTTYPSAQAAIVSAGPSDIVEVCPGVHEVAATLHDLGGLTIRSSSGNPDDTVFRQPEVHEGEEILLVSGDLTVEGIGFDGSVSDAGLVIEAGVAEQAVTLRNCVFDDFYDNVITARGDTHLVVEDSRFLEGSRNAISADGLTDRSSVSITGSVFTDNGSGFVHGLIHSTGACPSFTISDSEITGTWYALNPLLYIGRADDLPFEVLIEDTIIEDNRASDTNYATGLLHLEGWGHAPDSDGPQPSSLTVRGGRISGNEVDFGAAIYVESGSDHISVTLDEVDFGTGAGANTGDDLHYLGTNYPLDGTVSLSCDSAGGCL